MESNPLLILCGIGILIGIAFCTKLVLKARTQWLVVETELKKQLESDLNE